ncbi:MAG: LysR family transcriptional regulator [Myxococcota bacterium]
MAFAVFAEHLNFTRAAEELYISQPALHAKVGRLAEEVGTRLYVRNGRDLVLTEAGRLLAAHGRKVGALSDDVLAQIHDTQKRGPVTLAAGTGAFLHVLGPAIEEAREGPYPLNVLVTKSYTAASALLEARAHVGVGVFSNASSELEVVPWHEYGQMVAMPRDHALAGRKQLEPEDLAGEPLVIADEGLPHRVSTENVLDEHDVPWSVAVEATGWELMVRFVKYGFGVTIINDFVPLPDELVGIPVSGFPTLRYDIAIAADTSHEGTLWLRDLLLEY